MPASGIDQDVGGGGGGERGGELGKDFSLDCVTHLAPRANGKIALAAAPLALPAPNLQDPFLDHVCDCVTPVAAQTSTSQKNK